MLWQPVFLSCLQLSSVCAWVGLCAEDAYVCACTSEVKFCEDECAYGTVWALLIFALSAACTCIKMKTLFLWLERVYCLLLGAGVFWSLVWCYVAVYSHIFCNHPPPTFSLSHHPNPFLSSLTPSFSDQNSFKTERNRVAPNLLDPFSLQVSFFSIRLAKTCQLTVRWLAS